LTWNALRLVAFHLPWTWRHLVPESARVEWARIAAAMTATTLHVAAWAPDPDHPMPAWVPCRPCGGHRCTWDPMTQAAIDRRVAALAALSARRNAK